MSKKYLILYKVVLIALITTVASAHSGRTDSSGGHYNRSTGEYHYHNGGYDYQPPQQSQYIISMFQYKTFMGFGDTFSTKDTCMKKRYVLWMKFKEKGWTYGCRKIN